MSEPLPPAVVDLVRELARQTKRDALSWWAPPGEAWETAPINPHPGGAYDGMSYPSSTLYAFFSAGSIELNLYPGVRWAPAYEMRVRDEHGFVIETAVINAVGGDQDLFNDLQDTHRAALLQARVRETVNATDAINAMLDELRDAGDEVA